MTADPDLWLPSEQAYTPAPPTAADQHAFLRAFTDLHGPQPQPRTRRTTVTVGAIDDYEPGDHR